MPSHSKPTQHQHHRRRRTRGVRDARFKPAVRGLGDSPLNPPTKHGYSPDVYLTDDDDYSQGAPTVPLPAFSSTVRANSQLPTFLEHHDFFLASEHPSTRQTTPSTADISSTTTTITTTSSSSFSPPHSAETAPSTSTSTTSTPCRTGDTHADHLARLSKREYALRAADASDFASAWERVLAPRLADLLQQHCGCDFAVDVHNFPEVVCGDAAVPRVVFITVNNSGIGGGSGNGDGGDSGGDGDSGSDSDGDSGSDNGNGNGNGNGGGSGGDEATAGLEETLRAEVARAVPERFRPVHVEFRRGGGLRRTNWWWGNGGASADGGDDGLDWVCEPKNVTYRATPVMGMSIGPVNARDAAGSLGGFVRVGEYVYAMSASHVFEDALRACELRVCHPAEPDLAMLAPPDPAARPYPIGAVSMLAPTGSSRSSLTFRGMQVESGDTLVEMDWCLIGPVRNGVNVLPVPSFRMDQCVRVEATARVEGNTEVYAMARTSGYSLGFTSDVPGVQKIGGRMRREWTVRQYTPFKNPDDGRTRAPWQTLEQWVTSGIGVPGDSGAWLMRRTDNALIGLVWGRNHDSGDPLRRIRLTYFTPMVDILAEIEEKHAGGDEMALPVYQGHSDQVRRQHGG